MKSHKPEKVIFIAIFIAVMFVGVLKWFGIGARELEPSNQEIYENTQEILDILKRKL